MRLPLPSSLDLVGFPNAAMSQLSFDAHFGTSPSIDNLVDQLVRIKHNIYEVDRKVDSLLDQLTGNPAPEFHRAFVPGDNDPLEESSPLGGYSHPVKCGLD